jgi:hypothetical protein
MFEGVAYETELASCRLSVVTKMGGVGVEKMEGLGKSERELGVVGLAQDLVNGTAITTQGAAEMASGVEDGASASLHGGIVFGEGVVEERVLGEECESECGESGVEEVDDDELWGGEQSMELMGGHRFRAAGEGLALGVWAKTSRKSFSSRRASSRSVATARSSSARFMSTR